TNEKGQKVHSITNLSLRQAIFANAAMYSLCKSQLDAALKRQGKHISALTDTEQVYWTTRFFNQGPGGAEKELASAGVAEAHVKWTHPDDPMKYNRNPHYNATQREASYEYARDGMAHDKFSPIDPAKRGESTKTV